VQQKARVLACDHYHVIFTMPHALNDLWLANVAAMTPRLLAPVHATREQLLGDEKYLGACPGIIATLHTWPQTWLLHPHVHCLVTGGGLTESGDWVAVRHGFLLPVRVVMAVFRGKLLAALRQALARDQLTWLEGRSRQQLENLLKKLGRTKWNVHIRERYPHGVGVLTYVARSIRGGPFANQRRVACAQGMVTLRDRVNGEATDCRARGLMKLPIEEFIGRYRRHVPAPGPRVVRSYGLYAPTKQETLAVCREHLGQGPVEAPVVLDGQTACQARGDDHPERCPVCGQGLMCRGVVLPARSPPPRASSWAVVA
jgi:hypothetical protein